jgi:hypothetical protein
MVCNRDEFLRVCCQASLYGLTPNHKKDIPYSPPNTVFAIAKALVEAIETSIEKTPLWGLEELLRDFNKGVVHRYHKAPITAFWRL